MAWPKHVRRQALILANYRCQICQVRFLEKPNKLILHHLKSRRLGVHTLDLAVPRCKPCEKWAHQKARDGNVSLSEMESYRHHGRILQ